VDEHSSGKLAQHTLDSVNVCSHKLVFVGQSEHPINGPVGEGTAGILFDHNPRLKQIVMSESAVKPIWASVAAGTVCSPRLGRCAYVSLLYD
jgi:hypothetical protein